MTEAPNIYDSLPYPRLSYTQTHPDGMATIATLLGLETPALEACRVLEVGSAIGGNLIPMAIRWPHAQFLGVDLSGEQTEQARNTVKRLGLSNIAFEQRDIAAFNDDLEPFDFIIAHGMYSWVPPHARRALLETCARRLSPYGIAYISYNTFPGWHGLQAIRGIMQTTGRGIADPLERVRAGIDAVHFMRDTSPDNHPLAAFLDGYTEIAKSRQEMGEEVGLTLVLHDELSEYNQPYYLEEFVHDAADAGLTYMSDAVLASSFPNGIPDDVVAAISKRVRSAVEFEQYLDFFRHTTFRRSLLVQGGREVSHRLRPDLATLRRLYVRSRATAEESVDSASDQTATFVSAGGKLSTNHPLSKAAMVVLHKTDPSVLGFSELVDRAWASLGREGTAPEDEQLLLGANLLRGYTYSEELVDLRLVEPRLAAEPPERPLVDPYARLLAMEGERLVTNAYHERIRLVPAQAAVLSLLDGTRDRSRLAADLKGMLDAPSGEKLPDMLQVVEESLEFFAKAALLLQP